MKPKCTIVFDWEDKETCDKDASCRNKFGGFECPEHHSLPRNTQPDSFFKKGILVEELSSDTLWGLVRMYIAYVSFKLLDIKLWKKA